MPDPESTEKIHSIIVKLSDKFSTPPFIPHITLSSTPVMSLIKIRSKVDLIAAKASSFQIGLNKPVCGEPPFQRFSSAAKPSNQLRDLSETYDKLFNGKCGKNTFFHLSLLYGQIPCSEINQTFKQMELNLPLHLCIQNIVITDTSGPVKDWKILHKVALL